MRSYDDYRKAHEHAREQLTTKAWLKCAGAVFAFATFFSAWGFIITLLVLLTVGKVNASEGITDTEVEQAYWTHTMNKCVYRMSLKGHDLSTVMGTCRAEAFAALEDE